MKRYLINFIFLLTTLLFTNAYAEDTWTYTQSKEKLKLMTPATALTLLKEGNSRFIAGKMKNRNFLKQVKLTKNSQFPFAFILSCMDSRGSPELIFDQGIGDIFSGRVAGNVIDDDQLGGMEYAVRVIGAHIIVVMGHTSCGAVKGACEKVKLGNLTQLLDKITPAANTIKKQSQDSSLDCNDSTIVNAIAKQNVMNMIQEISKRSSIIKSLVDKKQVVIVGAIQDLSTGQVTFIK